MNGGRAPARLKGGIGTSLSPHRGFCSQAQDLPSVNAASWRGIWQLSDDPDDLPLRLLPDQVAHVSLRRLRVMDITLSGSVSPIHTHRCE